MKYLVTDFAIVSLENMFSIVIERDDEFEVILSYRDLRLNIKLYHHEDLHRCQAVLQEIYRQMFCEGRDVIDITHVNLKSYD